MRKGGRREGWELRWRETGRGQRATEARREGRRVGPLSWGPWLFEQLMGDKVGLCSQLPASGRAEPGGAGTSALEGMEEAAF